MWHVPSPSFVKVLNHDYFKEDWEAPGMEAYDDL